MMNGSGRGDLMMNGSGKMDTQETVSRIANGTAANGRRSIEPDEAPTESAPVGSGMKRLNINLPPAVYGTLQRLATETNRTMTDVVRTGLSLAKIALEAEKTNNKLAVVSQDGKISKEIVLLS
jgi:hypothetical protein